MVDFSKLQKATSRLNKESDSINETIKTIQEKINSLNPGLEVWLDRYDREALSISPPEKDQAGRIVERKTYLGYSKLNNKWALAVKEEENVEFWDRDERETVNRIEDTEYSYLLEASREIRIAALEKMQNLINVLGDLAEKASETIEEAKKIAEAVSGEDEPEVPKNQKALSGAFPPAIGPIEEKPKEMGRALTSETVMREAGKLKQNAIDPVKALDFPGDKTKKQ